MTADTGEARFSGILDSIGRDGWMMSLEERMMLYGILTSSGCRSVLELGYGEGGCTRWLSSFCDDVVTVDFDDRVLDARSMDNVRPIRGTTGYALSLLEKEGRLFDVAIVDAGHDTENVRSDILGAAKIADILVLHDIFYPPSRLGAQQALAQLQCWHAFDLVAGYFKDGALWGGIGVVCPRLPPRNLPLRSSAMGSDYIRGIFEIRKQRKLTKALRLAVRSAQLIGKVWKDVTTNRL